MNSLLITDLKRNKLCELIDSTEKRARNIVTKESASEIPTLSFDVPIIGDKWQYIINENLVFYDGEFYFIKTPTIEHSNDNKKYISVECSHLSSSLAETIISIDETTPCDPIALMRKALCYDGAKPTLGWSIGIVTVDTVKLRGLEAVEESPYSILCKIADKYDGILKFNSTTLTVDLIPRNEINLTNFEFRIKKNLKNISVKIDTSSLVTRLYGYGSTNRESGIELDIIDANPTKKPYIENYSFYLNKGYTQDYINAHPEMFLKINIFRDDNIYDSKDLYNATKKELDVLSEPSIEIKIEGLDEVKNPKMANLTIGNTVRIIDEDIKAEYLCNVISIERDYENPHLVNIELANSIRYRDIIKDLFNNVATHSLAFGSDGAIVGTKMDGNDFRAGKIIGTEFTNGTNFYVSPTGNLQCKNGNFDGVIKSTSGNIGGLTIDVDKISFEAASQIFISGVIEGTANFNMNGKRANSPVTNIMDWSFKTKNGEQAASGFIAPDSIHSESISSFYLSTDCLTVKANQGGFNGVYFSTIKGGLEVDVLKTTGSKNRVVKTLDYGNVLLNSVESPDCLFEDNGVGCINEDGYCYIFFDDIFKQTVNTIFQYTVQLTKCGLGDIYVDKTFEDYFVVKGTKELKFFWNVKAKQKGYETVRLERSDISSNNKINDINEGFLKEALKEEAKLKMQVENYYLNYLKELEEF